MFDEGFALAKGFDTCDFCTCILIGLESRQRYYFTSDDLWEFSTLCQKTKDFCEVKRQTFFQQKVYNCVTSRVRSWLLFNG